MNEKYIVNIESIEKYYTEKVAQYGLTSKGVDWSTKDGQLKRFEILIDHFAISASCSILDFGCGTGDLFSYLNDKGLRVDYTGYDVSSNMIKICQDRFVNELNSTFTTNLKDLEVYDYVIASGVFNVKLEKNSREWNKYTIELIELFREFCNKGFSFNCLTSYSDVEKQENRLYYGNPLKYFDFCKKNISQNVSLIHDYGMYEWTMIVKT